MTWGDFFSVMLPLLIIYYLVVLSNFSLVLEDGDLAPLWG